MDLKEILRLHGLYLVGDPTGKQADLTWANLTGADLTWANLTGADLTRADLTRADLTRADLRWANLAWADLTGADLTGANLTKADLRWANLTGADLRGADLTEADLTEANFTKADLRGADLTGTKVFTFQADLYRGCTVPGVDGKRILQFGCVRLTLDEWDSQHDELAEKHEPARAAKFAVLTRSIVATCRALDL
jgi:uncharacterized protein YjbI with pentapeptide repeats